jgi:hypothetical protein
LHNLKWRASQEATAKLVHIRFELLGLSFASGFVALARFVLMLAKSLTPIKNGLNKNEKFFAKTIDCIIAGRLR